MFSFQWPWLILLLPLPLGVRRFWPAAPEKRDHVPQLRLPALTYLQQAFHQLEHSQTSLLEKWQQHALVICWIGLVITLMNPQWLEKQIEVTQTGYDLMLAVDLSGSMETPDFFTTNNQNINRLEAVKLVLGPFIQRRSGDRMGLILFADQAYLQAPLTLDNQAVNALLQRAMLGMAGRDTAIGDALGLAVKKLRERPEGSRVIILLTDGDNNAGQLSPLRAAELAKQYKIQIYTIGVGSKDMFRGGLNEKPLQDIAQLTEGSYFPATDLDALTRVYEHIDATLQKTEAESRVYIQRTPLYRWPLTIALLALLFIQLLRIREIT